MKNFYQFVQTVKDLRGPSGCPWDKKQTHSSLTRFTLEEAYELVEAIDSGNVDAIKEELGDLLLQVVLNAQIASENGNFDIDDVVISINKKMHRRHPHVFGKKEISSEKQVREKWEEIKASEKKNLRKNRPFSNFNSMPSLIIAHKIGEKTAQAGFDWSSSEEVLEKVLEECFELNDSFATNSRAKKLEELGDLLFSLAQLARHLGSDGEQILRATNRKFSKRYQQMLSWCNKQGMDFDDLSAEEKEELWNQVKDTERASK